MSIIIIVIIIIVSTHTRLLLLNLVLLHLAVAAIPVSVQVMQFYRCHGNAFSIIVRYTTIWLKEMSRSTCTHDNNDLLTRLFFFMRFGFNTNSHNALKYFSTGRQ
jgi:hypothetical protein